MKTFLYFSALLLATSSLFGQLSQEHLIGLWNFEQMYLDENSDGNIANAINEHYAGAVLQFDEKGHYRFTTPQFNGLGSWSVIDSLLTFSYDGGENYCPIIILDDRQLVYGFDGKPLQFKKEMDAGQLQPIELPQTTDQSTTDSTLPKVESHQLTKKWELEKFIRAQPGKESEETKITESYSMTFVEGGKYAIVGDDGIPLIFTWELLPDKNTLVTQTNDRKIEWSIRTCSDTELLLANHNRTEEWFFHSREKLPEQSDIVFDDELGYEVADSNLLSFMNTNMFDDCTTNTSMETKTISNDLFEFQIPANWNTENLNRNQIGTLGFTRADSSAVSIYTSVVPFEKMYMRKNKYISFVRFLHGKFQGLNAQFMTRDDLPGGEDLRPNRWRNELVIHNKENEKVYYFHFTVWTAEDNEPSYCDFQAIINSLRIKND